MNKKAIFIFFLCFLLLFSILKLFSDQRKDNIEIYLVFDKSLSMVEELESVKNYVIDTIIDRIVIKGDYFLLIPFYGQTDKSFNGYINYQTDIDILRNNVLALLADGRFTDIGNALNTLRTNIMSDNPQLRKYMLLITDGKQEAPLNSPFYSPDGSFNHEFLENTKEIQKQGWKIIVLGIGNETDAENIAKELSAGYSGISNETTSREIDEKIDNFLGRLDILSINNKITLDKNGNSTINLKIESTNYNKIRDVKIIEIKLISETISNKNLLSQPYFLSIEPDNIVDIAIPVTFPISTEEYSADIIFVFEGSNSLTPAVHRVTVQNKKEFSVFYYLIILTIVVLVIIYYLLRVIRRKKLEDENKPDGT